MLHWPVRCLVCLLVMVCFSCTQDVKLQSIVESQMSRYPEMEVQDWYKLIHQAAMGNRHLGVEDSLIYNYLVMELNSVPASSQEPLLEYISPDSAVVRLNLRPYKADGGNEEVLFAAMKATWGKVTPSEELLQNYWHDLATIASQTGLKFKPDEVNHFFELKKEDGFPAVHHTERYEEKYKPAYRVLLREFVPE